MAELRKATGVRRVELVDAALHLIASRGIAALSTRSLASQMGFSTGAIFRHFASLDDLLDAVVDRVESVLEATYPPADGDPLERLALFIQARSAAVGSQLGILRLMLSEQFLMALPKSGSRRLAVCVQKTRSYVESALSEAQRDGAVRSDVAVSSLALMVMGTMQMLALSRGKAGLKDAQAEAVCSGLFQLLRPPGKRMQRSNKASRELR